MSLSLLIVEDDESLARSLARSFERRGHRVAHVAGHEALVALLATGARFDRAVVDLKLAGASGLVCIETLKAHDPAIRIVVLTGYASIATAVEAIKLGAAHYLVKPSDTDDIERAFAGESAAAAVPAQRSTIKTLEWERIHRTLADADFNISETARRLGMHRRTLARKLEKKPPR
ncbi:MAG: response regulator [Sphingomonas fennica]